MPRRWLDALKRALLVPQADSRLQACAAIVRRWPEFDADIRQQLLSGFKGSWSRVFTQLASDPSPTTRHAMAACLFALDRDEHLGLAVDLLADPQAGLIAERVLTRAAARAAESGVSGGIVEEELLRAACAYAIHQRRGVMAALALLLSPHDRESRLWRWVRANGPEVGALLSAIRGTHGPEMRDTAWRLAACSEVSPAATDRLGRARETGEHEVVLRSWHLAANPLRAQCVRGAGGVASEKRVAWTGLPTLAQLVRLSGPARCGAIKLAVLSGASHHLIDEYVGSLLGDIDPKVRYTAAREVPAELLSDLAFDHDQRVAGTAALRLAHCNVLAAPWDSLGRSPHQRVRAIAAARSRQGVAAWLAPSDSASRVTLRRMLAVDRMGTLDAARSLWSDCDHARRLAIARTIRALGLGGELADILIPAALAGWREAHDPAVLRWASAAATALGDADAERAGATLRGCLEAQDGRLRSNALEALVRIRRKEPSVLSRATVIELKGDGHHRVRASAIRAMTLLDDDSTSLTAAIAGEATSRMLEDDRAIHRMAGVWLTERLMGVGGLIRGGSGTDEAVELLRRCAATDVEPGVRTRAAACLEMMDVARQGAPGAQLMEGT
ncbi:MAG: hypothetical protein AABZ53_01725 [Planctomycetota bacterium]